MTLWRYRWAVAIVGTLIAAGVITASPDRAEAWHGYVGNAVYTRHIQISPNGRLMWTNFPRCATEDGHACYWNAQTMGNGHGHSFITSRGGRTFYVRQDSPGLPR